MKKPQLDPQWRHAWRWYSMHALVIAAALPAVWANIPPEWTAGWPNWLLSALAVVTGVCGVIGRLVQQPDRA